VFYIGFKTGPRVDGEGWRHAVGGIELGSDSDSFYSDLAAWTLADYEAQWREGIARLAAGERSSTLVTSYGGAGAAFHWMWPMWRVDDKVVFHERLVPGETVSEPNVSADFYAAVGERESRSEDGEPVSEWMVPFSDVLTFLADG
jgi:contact-dependent growth inhibition (CDI) system CdiI-like immunity protein